MSKKDLSTNDTTQVLAPSTSDSGSSDSRTPAPSDSRTLGPSDSRTPGLSDSRPPAPSDSRTSGPSDSRTSGPSDSRTPGPSDSRTLGPSDSRTSAPSDSRPPPDEDLYRSYAILRKIGDGGMGIVYLAKDRRLGRFVAIKRLKPASQADAVLRKRFLHEAKAEAALSHPGIVHIYTLGEDADGPYIVMEYVAASLPTSPSDPPPPPETLEQRIRHTGPPPASEAAELMLKIARAVEYAHSRGVIHRDLKPANILLDPYGEPKVADFGLARLSRPEDSHLTVPGEKLLSLGYGAPEQEDDASLSDERADVYGLGALFYFVLTGENPRYFREEDLPIPARAPLCKAMSRDREQRHASVRELIEDIEPLRNPTHVEAPTVKSTWRCKWCDTVNPVSIRFCAECGWDGVEPCRECGADLFSGMPFCRRCGASARDYEQLERVVAEAEKLLSAHAFDKLLGGTRFQAPPSFEPTGPNGRAMLERLRSVRSEAERSLARRDQIAELIPIEMSAENFERAEKYIQEFRGLSPGDSDAYAAELAAIPDGILRRDLARVKRLFRTADDEGARKLLRTLARKAPDHPEIVRLVRRDRLHSRRVAARRIAAVALVAAVLYLLSAPLASHYAADAPWLLPVYRPALRLYTGYPESVRGYVAFWHRRLPVEFSWFEWDDKSLEEHPDLRRALSELHRSRESAESEYTRATDSWARDYRAALRTLRDRYQEQGDFLVCQAIDTETTRFAKSQTLSAPAPGSSLPDDFVAIQTTFAQSHEALASARDNQNAEALRAALEKLEALRSDLTRSNRMSEAERVDREIKRLAAESSPSSAPTP